MTPLLASTPALFADVVGAGLVVVVLLGDVPAAFRGAKTPPPTVFGAMVPFTFAAAAWYCFSVAEPSDLKYARQLTTID